MRAFTLYALDTCRFLPYILSESFKNNFLFCFRVLQSLSLDQSDLSALQYLKETLDLPEPSPLQPLSDKFNLVCADLTPSILRTLTCLAQYVLLTQYIDSAGSACSRVLKHAV